MNTPLIELYARELDKLAHELQQYHTEALIWKTTKNVTNAAGNLALHLVGNLQYFIGAQLGKTDYTRDREAEFNTKHMPLNELLKKISHTKEIIITTLREFPTAEMTASYPLEKDGKTVTIKYMLLHLLTHLCYHLGQINYHRRLISN